MTGQLLMQSFLGKINSKNYLFILAYDRTSKLTISENFFTGILSL